MENKEMALLAATTLSKKKGIDIKLIDVAEKSSFADYLIIASGRTAAQVSALAEIVGESMEKDGCRLRRSEGIRDGRWAVLDYGDIMVHIFHRDERAYYGLDDLWNDGTNAIDLPFDQTDET